MDVHYVTLWSLSALSPTRSCCLMPPEVVHERGSPRLLVVEFKGFSFKVVVCFLSFA